MSGELSPFAARTPQPALDQTTTRAASGRARRRNITKVTRSIMDGRRLARFLALGPFVLGLECYVAHASGWIHAPVLWGWRGMALALICWEWGAVAWIHDWIKSGSARRLLERSPESRLARLLREKWR